MKMKKRFTYYPFLGLDGLLFGTNIRDIRRISGKYSTHSCGFPCNNHTLDVYEHYHCYFSPKNELEAIELFSGELVVSNTILHIGGDVKNLLSELRTLHCDIKYLDIDESYVCPSIGLMVYCPNNTVEDILLFSEHYFDDENKYLMEHFGVTKF